MELARSFVASVASALSILFHNLGEGLGEVVEISSHPPLDRSTLESAGYPALNCLEISILGAIDLLHPLSVHENREPAHVRAALFPVAVLPVSGAHHFVQAVHHGAGVDVGEHECPYATIAAFPGAGHAPVDILLWERGFQ